MAIVFGIMLGIQVLEVIMHFKYLLTDLISAGLPSHYGEHPCTLYNVHLVLSSINKLDNKAVTFKDF